LGKKAEITEGRKAGRERIGAGGGGVSENKTSSFPS